MLFTGPMKEMPPALSAMVVTVAGGESVVVTVWDGPVVAVGPTVGVIVGPTVGVIVGPTVGEVMAVMRGGENRCRGPRSAPSTTPAVTTIPTTASSQPGSRGLLTNSPGSVKWMLLPAVRACLSNPSP